MNKFILASAISALMKSGIDNVEYSACTQCTIYTIIIWTHRYKLIVGAWSKTLLIRRVCWANQYEIRWSTWILTNWVVIVYVIAPLTLSVGALLRHFIACLTCANIVEPEVIRWARCLACDIWSIHDDNAGIVAYNTNQLFWRNLLNSTRTLIWTIANCFVLRICIWWASNYACIIYEINVTRTTVALAIWIKLVYISGEIGTICFATLNGSWIDIETWYCRTRVLTLWQICGIIEEVECWACRYTAPWIICIELQELCSDASGNTFCAIYE